MPYIRASRDRGSGASPFSSLFHVQVIKLEPASSDCAKRVTPADYTRIRGQIDHRRETGELAQVDVGPFEEKSEE